MVYPLRNLKRHKPLARGMAVLSDRPVGARRLGAMAQSTNLQLPFLAAGQAQKHVTVNESLLRLDALVQLSVVSASIDDEPASPDDGALYILPSGKTGDAWDAMADHALAYWRDGTWEEIAPRHGWRAYVCDLDVLVAFDGAAWANVAPTAPPAFRVLAASGVAAAVTGTTSETALATITVPAGAMGANGVLRITTQWTTTNSANTKTLRTRFGGMSGTAFQSTGATASATFRHQVEIHNRNNVSAQVGMSPSASWGGSGGSATTGAINTASAQSIVLSGQLSNSGETITLESYLIELLEAA